MKTSESAIAGLVMLPMTFVGLALSLAGPCFLIFLVLKLCGTIDWSWWYVCAPIIAVASAVTILLIGACLLAAALDRFARI
jgi:hypothetical protein